jgi:hypothetical protein
MFHYRVTTDAPLYLVGLFVFLGHKALMAFSSPIVRFVGVV